MTQKTILCYGDSNTWGFKPQSDYTLPRERYPRDIRWPGVLQELLGSHYYVVEEGLNSRTTNVDHVSPPDRNGKTYLTPCLYSHAPIDLVVLALGGNDTKTYFNRSALEIKDGLAELVDIIQASEYGVGNVQSPQVLIVSPIIPQSFVEDYVDENGVEFLKGSIEKLVQLSELCADLAKEKDCLYLDLSKEIIPSVIDGVHLDEVAHKRYSEIVGTKIKGIL
jgi:lysophospholipase L1-like esterase